MYMSKKERALRGEVRKMTATDVHAYRMYLAEVRAASLAHIAAGTWDTNLFCFETFDEAEYIVSYWDNLYNPAPSEPELPIEEQLAIARSALESEQDCWDRYSGNNPNKYAKSLKRLKETVDMLERRMGAVR